MKSLVIAVAVLLGAVQAQANSYKVEQVSSEELLQYWNPRYIIKDVKTGVEGIPNTHVNTSYRPHYVKIFKTCQTGNTVRTIAPIKTCVSYKYAVKNTLECSGKVITSDNDKCVDQDRLVCEKEVMEVASNPIKGVGQACADYNSPEAWAWKSKAGNTEANFRTDFPNCSAFKTFTTTKPTKFVFEIIEKVAKSDARYDQVLGGALVKRVAYQIPQCGE